MTDCTNLPDGVPNDGHVAIFQTKDFAIGLMACAIAKPV